MQLSDGSSLYAKLVVGADGGKSHARELAGIRTTATSGFIGTRDMFSGFRMNVFHLKS